jgi:uncharacterized protein (DUF488 family)
MIAATILAILLIFGVGGGPFGELMTKYTRDPIKETIVEEDRQKMALHELKTLKGAIKDFNKHVSKDIKQFHKLVENYESTPEEFDQMISSVLVKHKQEVETIWERRSAMLAHIEADEWQTIVTSAKAKMQEKQKK